MRGHTYVADAKVLELFERVSRKDREALLKEFVALARAPYEPGDWLQRLPSGRNVRVRHCGFWLLTFWVDEPVLEVRIADVQKIIP